MPSETAKLAETPGLAPAPPPVPIPAADPVRDEDHLALAAACESGTALCTIVGIEGSFSRRLGAQLAIRGDGTVIGSLADGCLERQLANDAQKAEKPYVQRYGRGSKLIDFRLPCGGGLDILIDPQPDRKACKAVLTGLETRQPALLPLPDNEFLARRKFLPSLHVRAFGEGPELAALIAIGAAAGVAVQGVEKDNLALGQTSGLAPADGWTATVLLFHDHEWEIALLEEALATDAFYIGAQGGKQARALRLETMRSRGATETDLARIQSPIGQPRGSRAPQALALSVLAEICGAYEQLRSGD